MNPVAAYLTELALANVAVSEASRTLAQSRAADLWLAMTPDEQDEADWLREGRPVYQIEMRD